MPHINGEELRLLREEAWICEEQLRAVHEAAQAVILKAASWNEWYCISDDFMAALDKLKEVLDESKI